MKKFCTIFILLTICHLAKAQVYEDFLGAGHTIGMKITSSGQTANDSNSYVVTGTRLKPDLIGASRFLAQASLGASYEDIVHVNEIGIDAWMEEQFALPVQSFAGRYDEMYADITSQISEDNHLNRYGSQVFYDFLVKEPDVLRQKVALALSQIFVVSPYHGSALSDRTHYNMTYYDFLYQGAFGNYRDLLENISLSYPMATYLSHFMNQKADIIEKTFPDENYAREIMQLFSIGLLELNRDGTPKLDADGNTIPTYNINHITEMAKVFTGLAIGELDDGTINDNFFRTWGFNGRAPLIMFDEFHSKGEKNILPGVTIPAGQDGMVDIMQAIDILFNHDNVGPFLSKRMIQHLVKSNPSPAYVNRVASAFENNGQGVRGDFKAMVEAILLDPEARDCDWIGNTSNGKLIQPLERMTTIFKAFDISTPSDKYYFNDFGEVYEEVNQSFWSSPSVFNFFSPFYAEDEHVAPENLVSPEFQILNSVTAITYINGVESMVKTRPFRNMTLVNPDGRFLGFNPDDDPMLDFSDEIALYNNCLLYTSPSPRDATLSRMPSSA